MKIEKLDLNVGNPGGGAGGYVNPIVVKVNELIEAWNKRWLETEDHTVCFNCGQMFHKKAEPEWVKGKMYWFIDGDGGIENRNWTDSYLDRGRSYNER